MDGVRSHVHSFQKAGGAASLREGRASVKVGVKRISMALQTSHGGRHRKGDLTKPVTAAGRTRGVIAVTCSMTPDLALRL